MINKSIESVPQSGADFFILKLMVYEMIIIKQLLF